ncbi:MAG: hypothetical protein U5K70_00970 [Halodesulfurarchaeum sp.]|nr:hypothetical protein [Halodesulfurarchaeum sp.]
MSIGETVTVELSKEEMLPLHIEMIDVNRLSVGHYFRQRGDLLSDPEVVFEINDREWIPIRYRRDPTVDRHDPNGLAIGGFLETWDQNLQKQGYVTASSD